MLGRCLFSLSLFPNLLALNSCGFSFSFCCFTLCSQFSFFFLQLAVKSLSLLYCCSLFTFIFFIFTGLCCVPFIFFKTFVFIISLISFQICLDLFVIEVEINTNSHNLFVGQDFDVLSAILLPFLNEFHLLFSNINHLFVAVEFSFFNRSRFFPV